MKQNTRDKRLVKTHFFFPACFFLFLTVNLSAQNNIDPWWHPAIRALKKQAPGVMAFARSPEQLVQVCIVDTVKGKAYYVSQFGFVVDSIGLTANRKKQIRAITDQTVPFRWFEDSIGRYLAIFEDAKTFLRAYGSNFKKAGVLQQRVLSLPLLKAAPSTLAMLLEIETYERELQQVLLHFNWQVTTGRDIQVQFRQAEKPGSIIMHGTADSGYSEFINKEELVTTRKARLDHSTGGIRLYDWHNKVVDSFAINPGKVKTVIDEKADVFVLYHAWLEWKLQELNTVLPAWQYAANYELLTNRRGFIDAGLHNQRTGKAMLAWLRQEKTQVLEKLKALTTVADNVYSTNVVIYVYQENKQLWQWNGQGWVPEISPFYKESYTSRRGLKQYELTDHRGNVVATVSDKKTGVDMDGDGRVDSYEADITSVADYYPFGSSMPGRDKNSMEYRYGFNGKENDNEVKGKGSQQDYGMRIYDPRVGRFLSVDPLGKKFPFLSSYQYASNSPIAFIDLDGEEANYASFKMIAMATEAEAALYKNNTKDMPFRLQTQLFMLGMAKSASVEGLMYQIDKDLRVTFSNVPSVNFNELPPSIKRNLIQESIDRNFSPFGLVSISKGLGKTISSAISGNPESMGNLTGMLLAWRMYNIPESDLSTTASGQYLLNAKNIVGNSDQVVDLIGKGIVEFKQLDEIVIDSPKRLKINDADKVSKMSIRAPEFKGGETTESNFLDAAFKWLGKDYKDMGNGRYVSEDGLRQVRYGKHETTGSTHHGHFEAYDKPVNQGGKVVENTMVKIISNK